MSTLHTPQFATQPAGATLTQPGRTPRLALWLAKKNELIANPQVRYDLVMSGWFEPSEAATLMNRNSSTRLLAGLTHTWILDDPNWLGFLITVANGGNPNGPLQISEDMYLKLDDNHDGILDRKCSPPGWDKIYAMDPRYPGWRKLILAFYQTVATQEAHDGGVIDMLDAYPFCEGGWSGGVPTPLDAAGWVSAQDGLLGLIQGQVPAGKWVFANAGHDFPPGSPFPAHLNGYLLENFLGSWGANLEEGLASGGRALDSTAAPHTVVFALDTDDSGNIDWRRFRTGLAASLLMDNTYFAFDYGSRDHGGVNSWWFPEYYQIDLGKPLGTYIHKDGIYRRDFERGAIVVAAGRDTNLSFDTPHHDVASGETGLEFSVPKGDAGFFILEDGP